MKRSSTFWLVMVIVASLLLFTSPTLAQTSKDRNADRPIDHLDLPTVFTLAYYEYIGIVRPPNIKGVVLALRRHVTSELRRDGDLLDAYRHRQLVSGVYDNEGFLNEIDRAIAWAERLHKMPHQDIYLLGKKMEEMLADAPGAANVGGLDDWQANSVRSLARNLKILAIQRGSEAAALDRYMRYLGGDNEPTRGAGRGGLKDLGYRGFGPAQKILASRMSSGEGFPVNLQHAYYWALLARDRGENVTDLVVSLKPKLSDDDVRLVKKWVEEFSPDKRVGFPFEVPKRQ